MLKKDDKGNLEITRGNMLPLTITTNNKDGSPYTFQKGDVVRFSIMEKKDCKSVVLQKDVEVIEANEKVDITITADEMKIGDFISKPVEYWYEVELNPDKPNTQTIIGYTKKDGAKILTLTPESGVKE